MDEPRRRAWSRPELIVLVRSGPEEAVLSVCKLLAAAGEPGAYTSACGVSGPDPPPCSEAVGS